MPEPPTHPLPFSRGLEHSNDWPYTTPRAPKGDIVWSVHVLIIIIFDSFGGSCSQQGVEFSVVGARTFDARTTGVNIGRRVGAVVFHESFTTSVAVGLALFCVPTCCLE